ncbi:ATP synthase subunit I [Desulforhopalus singaporensis]|uniref:ATP synthase I chain n=1 Tax=Desulforhopalus singaporensis TaxID=91360 RepID=A0A1H0JS68_9BACT|nr:ATP synthase subunit I [Desulforhopalus singaporensis]SDO46454.1 ATP synthase I chain [Desulforhopalus singaporensis]
MTDEFAPLLMMKVASWIVLLCLALGSALFVNLDFAFSVLVGGLISICSFSVSASDVNRLIDSVTALRSPEERRERAQREQKGYLLKFWIRIVIIGVVLFVVIKWQLVNIFGLILGLSTVVISVTLVAIRLAGGYLFRGRR